MKMSTKGRYALRVMTDLAQHTDKGYTPLKDVALRQGISLKYMERILPELTKNKLIEGITGKGGGYRLTRKPEEYPIGEILRLTEGDLAPVMCMADGESLCAHSGTCKTLTMWSGLNKVINDYLDGVTLKDLI